MKLKQIPQNTVVHTPTEAEAKELLAILHENGWAVREPLDYVISEADGISIYPKPHWGWWENINSAKLNGNTILTLAEFKERYALNEDNFAKSEEDKPLPKFNKGDMVVYNGKRYIVEAVTNMGEYFLYSIDTQECDHLAALPASDLEPYTKPTENMETKDCPKTIVETQGKELNLCELLQGHEKEEIFLTTMGNVFIESVSEINIRFKPQETAKDSYLLKASGKMNEHGLVIAFPSRALYEQYPLDAAKAWSVWAEEQKKHWVSVTAWIDDIECESDTAIDTDNIYFRTASDRDKCIEEIKAVIEKYRNK